MLPKEDEDRAEMLQHSFEKEQVSQVPEAHACNPSYLEVEISWIAV
jgi:hypothetical protein